MERTPLSTARGKERTQLVAARYARHLSQDEVAAALGVSKVTVHRWEKEGDIPQPLHLRELCTLFGTSAQELGFSVPRAPEEAAVDVETINDTGNEEAEEGVLTEFRQRHLISRLMRIVWNWSRGDARYQMLQRLILLELEDTSMNDDMSRRDALRFLALVPTDMLGLSQFSSVSKKGFSQEDILKHCAAGIAACWSLRKGKELAFADLAVSTYIPPLKAMVQTASMAQRKSAADLLGQCLLLKATCVEQLYRNYAASLHYRKQAETYSEQAGNIALSIATLRAQAVSYDYADNWERAMHTTAKARNLIEAAEAEETPLLLTLQSYVYAGLANYQAHTGPKYKQDALISLGKAKTAFDAAIASKETAPTWIGYDEGNLLLNGGLAYYHLGMSQKAIDSFARIGQLPVAHETNRVASFIDQVMAEVNREDKPRDMDFCVDRWKQGIQGAIAMHSEQTFTEAIQAYTSMCISWPGEKRVKNLREYIVRW